MTLKIAVSPPGYDDIGAVLKAMGYKFAKITDSQLKDYRLLSKYEVVFINCSASCKKNAKGAAGALRHYVENGGSLYCSDYAAAHVVHAFPGYINFGGEGKKGSLTAHVTDEGLKAILGTTLSLTFDMSAWKTIDDVKNEVEVYLATNRQPFLVSFEYGQGQVIYTCFHNKAQVSHQEQQLLKFLVLKPVLAKAKSTIAAFVASKAAGTVENVGVLNSGQASRKYEYMSQGGGDLKFLLNWEGTTAKLSLSVFRPDGSVFEKVEATNPPVHVSVPTAIPGRWTYQASAIEVPYKNFPYVILAGPSVQIAIQDPSFWPGSDSRAIPVSQVDNEMLDQITIISEEMSLTADDISDLGIEFLDD